MSLKITHKLLLGFGIVIALSIAVGWYGLSRLAFVTELTATVVDHDTRLLQYIKQISASQDQMAILRERALAVNQLSAAGHIVRDASGEREEWRRQRQKTEKLLNQLSSVATQYRQQAESTERERNFTSISAAAEQALGLLNEVAAEVERQFTLAQRNDFSGIGDGLEKLSALRKAFDQPIDHAEMLVEESTRLGARVSREAYERARLSILLSLAIVIVLGAASSTLIQRSITGPLGNFMTIVERIGDGDLTQRAIGNGTDEISSLALSLNNMVKGLRDLANQTSEVTQSLNSASSEILASTQEQAASTTEQAAAVQETASTVDQISQSGKQISERAKEVATAAEASSTASSTGLQAVQDNARAMDSIREQAEAVAENIVALSEKMQSIGETITLVNDIAEKSNLLALNAAIEAASAGDQGRRFSVVANEIKNLADQSKDATKQVRSILEEIQQGINTLVMLTEEAVKRVESGKQQSDIAEHTIRQLSETTEESVTAFQQILAATSQQQIGIEQVSKALGNIRQTTEQTASGTSQLEKAAQSLTGLSRELQDTVQRYRM